MKDDQRIVLTKKLLKEGLFRILEKKELNKISVTELCEESGINRATFYRHYERPRDILNDLKTEMFIEVIKLGDNIESIEDLQKWLETTCVYFYENADLLKIFFKNRTDDEFVIFLNDICKSQFSEIRKNDTFAELDDDTMRLGAYYYAGGIYYILRQWLTEPINKSPKEVASLIFKFLNVL